MGGHGTRNIVRSEAGGNRLLWGIRGNVDRLSSINGLSRENAIRFSRANYILDSYSHILNEEGLRLRSDVSGINSSPTRSSIEGLLSELPSVGSPRLDLFVKPFSAETIKDQQFRALFADFNMPGKTYRMIQVGSGCFNNCLMCGAGQNEGKVRFMPFPMVLLLAGQLHAEGNEQIRLFYENSDLFFWKDRAFNADAGDLVLSLGSMGIKTSVITHGIWPHDIYATEAAEKVKNSGIERVLSVHLFHKEIFPEPDSGPDRAWLEKYARRYAHTITTLSPTEVRLLSDDNNTNPHLRGRYITQFYHDEVLGRVYEPVDAHIERPVLSADLAREGRAFGNPYFKNLTYFSRSIYDAEKIVKVSTDGTVSVSFHEPKMPRNGVAFTAARDVRTVFGAPDSIEFKYFLLKVKFFLTHAGCQEIDLWRSYFTKVFMKKNVQDLIKQVNSINMKGYFLHVIHDRLSSLPVVSTMLSESVSFSVLDKASVIDYFMKMLDGREHKIDRQFLGSFPEGKDALVKVKSILAGNEDPVIKAEKIMNAVSHLPSVELHTNMGFKALSKKSVVPLDIRANTGVGSQ